MICNWFKKERTQDETPSFWENYRRLMQHPLSAATPLNDIPFVVFDTETTGLDPRKDRILSIGALRVQNWSIPLDNHLELLVQQQYEPDSANVEIHGILPGEPGERLTEEETTRQFVDYAGNSVLVGHHAAFDLKVLNQALKRLNTGPLQNEVLDTAQLARRLHPTAHFQNPGDYRLDRLCERFGVPLNDRHTAAGDAFLTAVLFLKILGRLEKRGLRHLKDLLRG